MRGVVSAQPGPLLFLFHRTAENHRTEARKRVDKAENRGKTRPVRGLLRTGMSDKNVDKNVRALGGGRSTRRSSQSLDFLDDGLGIDPIPGQQLFRLA